MKIILSLPEVGEILAGHLLQTGKLKNIETNLQWHVVPDKLQY